jgi:hypothetical protein
MQALQPGDRWHCLQFCRWLVERAQKNADFITWVLCANELHYTQMGIVNTHNIHHSAYENLHFMQAREHQVHWSFNVWARLLWDSIIDPYLLPEHLTTTTYYAIIGTEGCSSGQQRTHVVPAWRHTTTLWASCS